ncbi:MAG TPA: GNAT family N-acetyltransferase [Ideonella sp.]|uniref:GNAT family N-acetyltransferase n=1 Tax=Ideonella sp. TaxID=1929293 RepID=UPI002E3028A2|nr:GNAT family N-acetyltransferase [Ideonella sp.]HEX5687457.1 GNAT family N-acetyltransferase [Ideonella sp.]
MPNVKIDYTIPPGGWRPREAGITRLRALRPASDAPWLHDWFTQPRATFWGMQQHTLAQVEATYAELVGSGHALAGVGEIEDRSAFVLECYDPAHDVLGAHFEVRPGDVGMHFFVGPAHAGAGPIPGYTRHVFRTLMCFIFEHLGACRVVVEPDIRNHKVHALNAAMGFEVHAPLTLPHKTALLSSCTREQFRRAMALDSRFDSLLLEQPLEQPLTEDSAT